MNDLLVGIAQDWPLLALLLVILIGLYRLANSTITILDSHLGILIEKLEVIADEIREYRVRGRDS